MNTIVSDILIVGGGISGLYTAYKALLKNRNHKIILLEKTTRLGGRIYTYNHPDFPISVEHGAGRFHRGHRRLIRLLGELGLTDKIGKAGSIHETPFLKNLIEKILHFYENRKNDQDLELSFHDYVLNHDIISLDEFYYIESHYGYSTELFHMNIRDMIDLMQDMRSHNFLVLHGGLSQIIECLRKAIIDMGGEIHMGKEVTNIKCTKKHGNDGMNHKEEFLVYIANSPVILSCKKCVLAIPKQDLLKLPILRPIKSLLKTVHTSPLCRIYATYDVGECGPWFRDLPKTAAKNNLRLVIPSNKEKGVIMISYTDDKYAKWWNQIYKTGGKPAIKRELTRLVAEEFPWAGSPIPRKLNIAYWEHGVGYWLDGVKDSGKIAKKVARPFGNHVGIYICGENYSPKQQWMESALATCPLL